MGRLILPPPIFALSKSKLILLLALFLGINCAWADPAAVGTTLFSENFSGYSADDVPSGSVSSSTGNRVIYGGGSVTYTSADNGSNKTKIYSASLAGGTSPELLVGKSGGVFTITGIPSGDAQEITVSFKQNAQKLTISLDGTGYSTTYASPKPSAAGTVSFDITVADGADATFSLIMTAGSSNVRVDDILVTVKTAGEGGAPAPTLTAVTVSGAPTKTSYYAGDNFEPAGLTVKGTYDDSSVEDITSGITWTYNPSQTLVKDQTSIGVVATVSEIASAEYNVTGLTVTAASPKITITQDEVADFTNTYAEYTWTAGGVSGKMFAYKNSGMQFNSSKTGYYVYNTDAIPGRITKITMTQASGTARNWTPYVSTTAMTSASGTALEAKSVTTSGVSWDVTGSNSYFYLTLTGGSTVISSIVIEYTEDAPPAIDAPSISGDVNFVGSTTVTISHDDAEHIYYTTNGDDPTTSSTEYLAPFTVDADGTTTVKAIAVKGSDVSDPATKTFTKVEALESLAALLEATTSTETGYNVVISDWVVTGAISNRAWISNAENTKGILLYKSGHGFTAGKKLNGVVLGTKAKIYQGYPELTSLVSTEVTVSDAAEITPRETTLAAIVSGYNVEQGTLVKLENVTYAASTGFSDGINTVALSTQLYGPTMVDGATYNIIGVVRYDNGPVYSIMPRSVDDVEQISGGGLPEVDGLAALKAADRGTYILTLTNAVISYVNGKNAFIEDATGGALIFFQDHGFTAGDCLNGDYQVVTTDYQGKFEITAMDPHAGAATTTAAIPLTTVSIATLNANFGSYESMRVKIVGANVTDAISGSDRNGAINDGAALAVYAGVASTITLTADDNVDIIGYPGFHNTDQQLTVWQQSDITVNEKDPAGIAFTPESETITGGDPWSAPAFANPNSLTVTFSGDNDAVATVNTTTGEIALAGGYGTAVITAHTDGDATHNAGNATYTITVNDPSSVDTRKVANGPAAFTTTNGFLTPSDILFISHKGGAATAPAIYNDGIRLYQISGTNAYGGYVTLIAKKGCKIDEVEITTTNTYATSVGYYVNGEEASILGQENVAKSGTYNTATGLNADSVRILNLGTGSKGRLEIASITVRYNGDAAAVDHYELGGTYQTEFEIDDAFNHDGMIIYMAFDEGGTEKIDLTEGCTFSEPDMTVAGAPTVEISLGTTAITSYDITVAASTLLEPELSYDPTSVTLTQGDALSAPTFNNPHTLSPITYNSSKTAVATVDEFGVITLAGGTGTATITASFAGDATYQAGNATFTITVNEPEEDLTGTWEFATSVAAGDRIIIASIAEAGEVTTLGAQGSSNRGGVTSTVAGTELTPAAGSKSVTLVDAGEGKFALQLNNGSYLYASSNSSNQLKETAAYADNENAKWTFAFDGEGVATITAQGTNSHNVMRYNPNGGSPLFACYTSTSTTGTLVTVYKKDVPAPVYETVRAGLTPNHYYTICYPKAMTDIQGATLWSFVGRNAEFAYIEMETATTIEAGKPYIMYATASTVTAVLGDETNAPGANGAIHGTFSNLTQDQLNNYATVAGSDLYLVIGDELRRATGASTGSNTLPAYRAFVVVAEIPNDTPVPAPGKKVRKMPMQGQTTTGCELINAAEAPAKMMINGQLYILRGEKKYDATGRLVK